MNTPEDKDFELREAELQARERELRLREMEAEIDRSRQPHEVDIDPPLHRTTKHKPTENSIRKFGKKVVKFAKFAGFVVGGIVVIRIGFLVGMWITYLMMAGIIAAIGYQIFLADD